MVVFSQKQNIQFEHLDINRGLSQNHIMSILQDSRGFMWFGTRDGLNKYDGYRVTVYKNNAKDSGSISNNFITGLLEDSKGVIWVASRGGGLNRYDKEKNSFTHFKNDPQNPNSISSDLATNLSIDSNDNLWICTERGLNYFNPGKNRFEHYSFNARCVFEDSRKNVWVGGNEGGLNLFTKKTKTFTPARYNAKDSALSASDNVAVIFEDSKQQLWIGTVGNGLYSFDKTTGKFTHFLNDINNANSLPGNTVFAIGEDNGHNLWIGSENGGLAIYNSTSGIFQRYVHDDIDNQSISNNSVYSVYKDVSGNMWAGTFAGGVNIFNKNANGFAHYYHTSDINSLNNNNVLCMLESKNGKIWIGTDGGGLNLFDPVTKYFTHYLHSAANKKSICGNYVLSVLEDSKGNVWVGTWADGITIFNPKKNTFIHLKNVPGDSSSLSSNNAWVIFEDRDKHIWVGTYNGGLNLYNPSTNSFIRMDDHTGSISAKRMYSVTEDSKDNLWLGTDGGGLQVFNKKTKTFTTFTHNDNKNSISDNRVNNAYEDEKGNFWIATMAGLNYFDIKKQVFKIYTTEDGLPNSVIFGLLKDTNGYLWISTNRGLSRFDANTSAFKNYGVADGLQSYEFKMRAFCKSASGTMYFGGINGFNEFDPAAITQNAFEPPLVLTSFQVFNKEVAIASNNNPSPLRKEISETREITMSYDNSVFSFEFASLNYTVDEKKKYAYRLEGFDKDWNNTGTHRTATYTNLNPGKYIFKVKGLNNQGEWSTHIIEVKLTITPPFWLTWWFKSAVLLMIIAATVGFYKFRIKSIKAQKIKLEKKVNEQTKQLIQSASEEKKARKEAEKAKLEVEYVNKEMIQKNKELEQFVYIASHDLQEPLRTTTSFVELLQRQYNGKFDEKADKYFNFIAEASDRMKTLIKDLLDYSRIGAKKECVKLDCNIILQKVLADLGSAIDQANAIITADQLPVITVYPVEIKQLFQNLLINAIKFRKKDIAPEIKVSVQSAGDYWEFSVKDNGIGIEEQYREKIFLIFQRLHTKTAYEGSGIGLAHSKKIVEMHGGKIWIESALGNGTTFYFTILKNIKS
ncbi:two-component regulator propeller domain-containing protein [Ferruginibacter sp.]|uniref:ligand-binding sensor domain-containing protein n=1 Tax=Ferruginibacter sp. TaxID=1940288 RepID=UPI00265B5FD8|nr:two-component regulator propeller domain-containing protein [Ferruginibacter sp.]